MKIKILKLTESPLPSIAPQLIWGWELWQDGTLITYGFCHLRKHTKKFAADAAAYFLGRQIK